MKKIFNTTLVKRDGKLEHTIQAKEALLDELIKDLPEGTKIEVFANTVGMKGSNAQLAKIHAMLRQLANDIGEDAASLKQQIKEEAIAADKAFVNDSFWLLYPFHLVWHEIEVITYDNQLSPLLNKTTTKLRVNYPSEGGYTPGDSYEVYVDDNYNIVEWTYHRGGSDEAGLGNTFESQQSFNGIKVDMEHSNSEIGFQLNFRNVTIK